MPFEKQNWEERFDKKFGTFSVNVNKNPLTSKSLKDFIK